jgi:hypothetical protein
MCHFVIKCKLQSSTIFTPYFPLLQGKRLNKHAEGDTRMGNAGPLTGKVSNHIDPTIGYTDQLTVQIPELCHPKTNVFHQAGDDEVLQ